MTRCPTRSTTRKCTRMTDTKVWLVTGAGRGMGLDIANAALAAGHAVVATARNPDTVTAALAEDDDVLAVRLDVTDPADATRPSRLRSTGSGADRHCLEEHERPARRRPRQARQRPGPARKSRRAAAALRRRRRRDRNCRAEGERPPRPG